MGEIARHTDVYKYGELIDTFIGDDSFKQAQDKYGEPKYPECVFSTYFTSATSFEAAEVKFSHNG